MITDLPDKAYLSAVTVTNISRSFTHKMAAKINWHRYGTRLRHCYPDLHLSLSQTMSDDAYRQLYIVARNCLVPAQNKFQMLLSAARRL